MMDIKLLKKLREQTGAGMLECKTALEKYNDDYEQALNHINSNIKKDAGNTRVASKGMCKIEIKDNEAILFEINAETDFVTKNEHFTKMVDKIGSHLITSDVFNAKAALKEIIDGKTIEEHLTNMSAIIGENAHLRRFYRVVKDKHQAFGSYTHMQGKLVTLVIIDQNQKDIANQLAMQVAAMSAEYLSLEFIDQDTMNYEKFMYEKVHGKYNEQDFMTNLKSKTLLSQPWIKDDLLTVKDYLDQHQIKIIDFFKFELGQGIDNKLNCRLDIPCDGSKITVTPIL
jgi:elongation factor Ts